MSAPFEERSGVVPCGTPWGQWYQTLEEVFIEVQVPPGTRAQDIQCGLQSRHVALAVGGREILKGKLFDSTIADEGTWTLEDRKMVRIVLTKTKRDAANCWTSLLESEYAADPWVQDQMQRKLTLERFQKEDWNFKLYENFDVYSLEELLACFPKWLHHFTFPPAVYESSTALSTLVSLFDSCYPSGCKVLAQCRFYLCFLDD
ncbi:NudC domain containing 2 [Rhinolophus ferrumequinum]|uniref:NudC domain-containing protein 2 n=1 Tax=Rhinolophus ferrumequinum TaxID=59479 RepID=A0A7J7RYJ5_RHIFE|nr:NudC domain containing 2 [Rhinolophus ferrumequinum]